MTPEERAKEALATVPFPNRPRYEEVETAVATAITEAVEAEREACAKVAEDCLPGYRGRLIEAFDFIAAAIRARGKA